jgi:hypothetical protein
LNAERSRKYRQEQKKAKKAKNSRLRKQIQKYKDMADKYHLEIELAEKVKEMLPQLPNQLRKGGSASIGN